LDCFLKPVKFNRIIKNSGGCHEINERPACQRGVNIPPEEEKPLDDDERAKQIFKMVQK